MPDTENDVAPRPRRGPSRPRANEKVVEKPVGKQLN